MPKTYSTVLAGQKLELRADRSLWWPDQSILFIADLHAGKVEHFQKYGQPIPGGNLQSDLARLHHSIIELQPKRLIVLGDLFHSEINSEWQVLSIWIKAQPCRVELIRGNHDRFISDETFSAGGLLVHAENLLVGPFNLRHHPSEDATRTVLCGHLHPVHTFAGPGLDRLRLPSFVVQNHQIILPAYGSFTGGLAVGPRMGIVIGTGPDFETILVDSRRA